MATLEFEMKQGETGKVLSVTLRDSAGPIDLTGWSAVTMTARQGNGDPVIDDEPCSITDADNGVVSFAFTGAFANISPGEYDMEFRGVDVADGVHIFPSDGYGTLIVNRPL